MCKVIKLVEGGEEQDGRMSDDRFKAESIQKPFKVDAGNILLVGVPIFTKLELYNA